MHQALAPYRLGPQLLAGSTAARPTDVVRHLGAVQSQEHTTIPWSIARRLRADRTPPLPAVLDDLDAGGVVRTHVLRTTWHHVHVDDLPLFVAATADRVMAQVVGHVRRLGVEESALVAASEVVTAAVRDSPGCTRDDVARRLEEAGRPARGDVLAHVVMAAELRGEIAGTRRPGAQHLYRPLTQAPTSSDEASARSWLARTYARGHGPVTAADLAWWSSLTLTQARAAIADAGLHDVEVAGRRCWSEVPPAELDTRRAEVPRVLLLAQFDELISYARDPDVRAEVGARWSDVMNAFGLLVIDGRLAGHWSRTVRRDELVIDVTTDAALTAPQRRALDAEAGALGALWALDPHVTTTP